MSKLTIKNIKLHFIKSRKCPGELVEDNVGYDPAGVCPFAVKPDVTIYLDVFLKCNDVV